MFENGKSYSELERTCLELAALSIKLNPLEEGAKTKGAPAYILFNADRTKAELFLPKEDKGIALTKTSEGNWGNNEFKLIAWKGYVVQRRGKAVYGGQ